MIRISGRGFLRQWRRFGAYLYKRGLHHTRRQFSCVPSPKGKGPHWYRRKQRRRYLRRMKRFEAMWARYKKQPRLSDREFKIKQRKQFIEELYRRIKIMAPYYRMRHKVFAVGSINCFEILNRKIAIKKWVLETYLADQRILLTQLSFLKSTSTMAEIRRSVWLIDTLTRTKIRWAKDFKEALVQRKIINRRLAEKRKYFLNILVPLAEYYHKIKKYDNVSIPRYFADIEKMVYQERNVQPHKAAEQHFLQVFAVSQMKYMELKAAAKEMGFYLRTRYFFTAGISRVLNHLYFAKDVVLNLLRDGHEVLTTMFHYYETYTTMEDLQTKLQRILEKRRLKAYYKRRQLEFEVEYLLHKHKSHKETRMCHSDLVWIPYSKFNDKEFITDVLHEIFRGYRYVVHRCYIDDMDENKMKIVWDRYPGNIEDLTLSALKITVRFLSKLQSIQDENNRALYFEIKEKFYADIILYVFYSSVLYSVRACIYLIYCRRLRPHAYDVEVEGLKKLYLVHEDQRLFEIAVRRMFRLTKRTQAYKRGQLGLHHRMTGGNRDVCMRSEFKFFRMFLAIKNSITSKEEYQLWSRMRKQREEIKHRKRLISMAVHAKVNKEVLNTFNFYRTKFDTICPLCCSAEREIILKTIGAREDMFQNIPDVVACAQYYFLGARTINLTHDIEHCSEPAATFLLKIKILEDRRKMSYLGKDKWIKF